MSKNQNDMINFTLLGAQAPETSFVFDDVGYFSAFKFDYVEDLPPQGEASLETFLADFP